MSTRSHAWPHALLVQCSDCTAVIRMEKKKLSGTRLMEEERTTSVTSYVLSGSGDSLVAVAIRFGLGGSRFETRWGREVFSSRYPPTPTLGPSQPPLQWLIGALYLG